MPQTCLSLALAGALLAGLPWIRAPRDEPPAPAPQAAEPQGPPPDRVLVLAAASAAYRALATPRSVRVGEDAPDRLVVFRHGVCVLDRGLRESRRASEPGAMVVEEAGLVERAVVAPDAREAVVITTRYDSRVDLTPGVTSTDGDVVRGVTTLTLVDPAHPDGRWQLSLEDGRWIKLVELLAGGSGVVMTTFLPRTGPTDLRVLDPLGRERLRIPETRAETVSVVTSCTAGCYVAADVKFREEVAPRPERGVIVFDVATSASWTYGWRYGTVDEPSSWSLGPAGVLTVRLPGATRRFDATGKHL